MPVTLTDLDLAANRLPGQTTFSVNGVDYAALVALGNANATADLGGYFYYDAAQGGGLRRRIRVESEGTVGGIVVPVDSGVVEGG